MAKGNKIVAGPCPEIIGSPHFRSAWERNVYRALYKLGYATTILYEPKTFVFPTPYRKCLDYKPDFLIDRETPREKWIEVKGWLDGKSKTKLQGFKKHFPTEASRLLVITEKYYMGWVQENIGCEVWDYHVLKRQAGSYVAWEG